MALATGLSAAMEWREKVIELREVAEHIADPQLRERLFALADHWDEFANKLELAQARWSRH
jgi:hypothetical protein